MTGCQHDYFENYCVKCGAPKMPAAAINTDRELWRETSGDFYSPSLHVTATGGIGMNVGGTVIVRPVREWHRMADDYDLVAALREIMNAVGTSSLAWKLANDALVRRGQK